MMSGLYIACGLVLLAAIIDALRIRLRWGHIGNINHAISWIAGAGLAAGQWFVQHPQWQWWLFILLCGACRLLLYDPVLNLLRRERIDYVSPTTSSAKDGLAGRLHFSFWTQRAIGASMLIIISLIQLFIK